MAITARFYVRQMTRHAGPARPAPGQVVPEADFTVELVPAYKNGSNAEWSKWTPTGRIEMRVTNPDAVAEFERCMDGGFDLEVTFQALPPDLD